LLVRNLFHINVIVLGENIFQVEIYFNQSTLYNLYFLFYFIN